MNRKYDLYKDSGVEWLKEIPKEWPVAKFKRFAKIRNGKDQKAVLTENGEYPVLGTGGEFGRANEFLYDQPSLLLGRKGTIDKPQFIEEPFWTVDTLFYTEVLEDNSPKYLYYFSQIFPFSLLQESSAVPSMTQGKLHNLELCKPSREEQIKIAQYLDHQTGLIDAIIEKKQLLLEKLKEQRQAIINEAVTKGLDPNVPMKDSGVEWLGFYNSNWQVKRVKHVTYVKGRIGWQNLRAEDFRDVGPHLVTGTDFHKGLIDWNSCHRVDLDRYEVDSNIQLKENDVLITKDGTIGKVAIVKNKPEMATLNTGVFVTRPFGNVYEQDFFYWILVSDIFTNFIDYNKSGATIQHLYQNVFNEFSFALPTDIEDQKIISAYLKRKSSEIDDLVGKNEKLIKLLKNYRKSIISDAVTGKIDVRQWEPQVKETA